MFSDDALLTVPGKEGCPAGDGVRLVDNNFGFTPLAGIVVGFVCGLRNVSTSLQDRSAQSRISQGRNIHRWLGLTGGTLGVVGFSGQELFVRVKLK